MSTDTDMGQHSGQSTDALLSKYQYNRRKLKIVLEKNVVSRGQYADIKTVLDRDFKKGQQLEFEEIFQSHIQLSLKELYPVLNKELFKYNQIIIKLAQQFSKNTTIQQLKLQNKDKQVIQKSAAALQRSFSAMSKMLTNEYLKGRQRNIDDILLESGFIKVSQLEFLHNSALHLEIKVQDRKFGEIAVKNQFATQEIVNKALNEQTEIYRKTSKNHIIGDILVKQKQIPPEVRDEILIIQNRVLEEDWEENLKKAGQSSIEEKEQNALFGALIIKEKLLDEKKVVEALKIQARETADYKKKQEGKRKKHKPSKREGKEEEVAGEVDKKPRWIGDILVENFGLPEKERKKIVKKQMAYRIERINLKLGLNLTNAHLELFDEMEKYFLLTYSKDRVEAYIKLLSPLPKTMTKENLMIWLYHKKISYGRISSVLTDLISNTIKPGSRTLLARGDVPVPAKVASEIHFDAENTSGGAAGGSRLPSIVNKGSKLMSLHTQKGKSGLSVNRCFVPPPLVSSRIIVKGQNVVKDSRGIFIAACDGVPHLSDKGVLSVNSTVSVRGDVMPVDSPVRFECDFDVQGTVQPDVILQCRSLKSRGLKGQVRCSETAVITNEVVGGDVAAKGSISLASVEKSAITSEKDITVQLRVEDEPSVFNKIYDSVLSSNGVFKISDAKIISSVIRAGSKIILKKTTIGKKCRFIVGDCLETVACKARIEALNSEIKKNDAKIKILQQRSRELFAKIEKKDIVALEEKIKSIRKRQKTKAHLDKIGELRLIKRQKEKQYEANIDEYGNIFMQNSNKIKAQQAKRSALEREDTEIKKEIVALYKKNPESPELDVRRTMLPAGTVIQFRYSHKVLEKDCEGFVFREELDTALNVYEIKKYRW